MAKDNGTPKQPSRLDSLNAQFVNAGGKTPAKKVVQELVGAWRKAQEAKKNAEAAVERAAQAESEAAANLIRQVCGKKRIRMPDDGVVYVPMCRGETVFLRREGGGDVVEFE